MYDEIEKAYLELPSIFDRIRSEDFVIAFFPCTEFEDQKNMLMLGNNYSQRGWDDYKKLNYNLYMHDKLSKNYEIITKLVLVCIRNNIPLLIENPKGTCHYLTRNWSIKPSIIDLDRRIDGDYYKKPTQYWFINTVPKNNLLMEPVEKVETRGRIEDVHETKARSEIHPQYAERFIKKYIACYENGKWYV